ncbi:MAG: RtcB family protein [Actinobacteria bacterium HGW-Actinobacteria-10]|nr:MAG: RtcB family protein [Actinobacteria bacterium HGW-Actinobacteria-10]
MYTIETEHIPILVWGEDIDEGALTQARNLANLPFAFHHIALMPDAHVGYGMPIGGVFAAQGQVVPHAVGLDIGCGVRAWRTNVPVEALTGELDLVLNRIQRDVPQGFDWHKQSQAFRTDLFDAVPDIPALQAEMTNARRQVGSLGGGNHFIELQADPDGVAWAMVHSGSRNVGKQIAEHFDKVARDINRQDGSPVPPQWGLAHLDCESPEGIEYLAAMHWCMRFAAENRRLMAEAVQSSLDKSFPGIRPDAAVEVHHNYAATETHYGEEVVVHRKGAVYARGRVFIPGSMGTSSYVGEGLANADAFESCSHGAGRTMSRKAALQSFSIEHVMGELKDQGIKLFKAHKKDVAEEAPGAYKDIDMVMRWQRDLVEPRIQLRPLGVVKG